MLLSSECPGTSEDVHSQRMKKQVVSVKQKQRETDSQDNACPSGSQRANAAKGKMGKVQFQYSRFLGEAKFEVPGGHRWTDRKGSSWNVASSGYKWEDNPNTRYSHWS